MANTKKTLLSESQVRQFMKLAKLEPLSPGFVNGLTEKAAFKKGQQTKVLLGKYLVRNITYQL